MENYECYKKEAERILREAENIKEEINKVEDKLGRMTEKNNAFSNLLHLRKMVFLRLFIVDCVTYSSSEE